MTSSRNTSGQPAMGSLAQQADDLFALTLTAEQEAMFAVYARELAAWNAKMNLTAITAPDEVQVRHFLDSLSVVQAAPLSEGMKIIDVGTGAGFPGLPLAILSSGVRVTLMEATRKKLAFLDHVIQLLSLQNAVTLHARAEEAGQDPAHRAKYDLVLARAVARLPSLLEYLLPLARVGGLCVAMKGRTAHEEAATSVKALSLLGGRLRGIKEVALPDVEEAHYLVVVEKVAGTPAAYPRKPGTPTSKPLI